MIKNRFFICEHCGNMIEMVKSSGASVVCCGKEMTELVANTVEASVEKHLPVVEVKDRIVNVKVGSVAHPMVQEHNIEWIYLETINGIQRKLLKVDSQPEMSFALTEDDEPIAVYAYCNLHGLWKTEL